MKATLIRKSDNLQKSGNLCFIEFDNSNRGKALHDEPQIGFAAIVDPHPISYTWMTSIITEVISSTEFKTQNSHYTIIYDESSTKNL